jgi:hypothetical protein
MIWKKEQIVFRKMKSFQNAGLLIIYLWRHSFREMFGDEFIAGIIRKTIIWKPKTYWLSLSCHLSDHTVSGRKDKLLILDVILARELMNNKQLGRIGLSANRIKMF